jgi:hypothetical protein
MTNAEREWLLQETLRILRRVVRQLDDFEYLIDTARALARR